MHWKTRIYENAYKIADSFKDNPNIIAVAIGGSIARGLVWKHSDVELCIIVENKMDEYQHFNYIDGLGVEIIQLKRHKVREFIDGFKGPDRKLLKFPIQIYQCKIIHDPTNILAEFKNIYDKYLFHPDITGIQEKNSINAADDNYLKAKESLEKGCYKTSLAYLRLAVNDLMLAYYWHYNILPRSQSRTVYLLKKNSKIIGNESLYKAFKAIYCLNKPQSYMKDMLLKAKKDIFAVSEQWGSNTPEFLEKAVDGNLEWGYPKSIMYVYKWCVHLLQYNNLSEYLYDSKSFEDEYKNFADFLDMTDIKPEEVRDMLMQFEEVRKGI